MLDKLTQSKFWNDAIAFGKRHKLATGLGIIGGLAAFFGYRKRHEVKRLVARRHSA